MKTMIGVHTAPNEAMGYHGCSEEAAESILSSGVFIPSVNPYDWLGMGTYFFENGPYHALEWAQTYYKNKGKKPAVIEARIDLTGCLNLLDTEHMGGLLQVFNALQEVYIRDGMEIPLNTARGRRNLDRIVIDTLYDTEVDAGLKGFTAVRGAFIEGQPAYPGATFFSKTHIQIAVRDPCCISGIKRVY